MLFRAQELKVKLLAAIGDDENIAQIKKRVENVFDDPAFSSFTSPGIVKAIVFDLCYCLYRHITWINASLFTEIAGEFIHAEYCLPHTLASALAVQAVEVLKETQSETLSTEDAHAMDRDFLRYIFVACATASDDATLVADLGLGTGLIKCIKSTAETLMSADGQSSNGVIHFKATVDKIIGEIMVEISDEIKVTPWIMDIYHLNYLLRAKQRPDLAATSRSLFHILLAIGKESCASYEKVLSSCEKYCGQAPAALQGIDPPVSAALIEQLIALDLIFEENPNLPPARKTFRLTETAQKLTCDAFACKFLRVDSPDFSRFIHLNPYYQTAIIRRTPDGFRDEIIRICRDNLYRVSPKALELLIKLFSRSINHNALFAIFKPAFENDLEMPWLKSALLRGMATLHKADDIYDFLANMTKAASSPKVKSAANFALGALITRQKQAVAAKSPLPQTSENR